MGIFRSLFGGPLVVDVMRLIILMDYRVSLREGRAALRWDIPDISSPTFQHEGIEGVQATLIALLYGRILCVHKETRDELFVRVNKLAIENVRSEGESGFEFENWVLHAGLGAGDHRLWPWSLVSAEELVESKEYSVILQAGRPTKIAPTGRWIYLGMAWGSERILAPSSALIAINWFSRNCTQESRYMLALLLWQMNAYWKEPTLVSQCSEALAYAAAYSAIRYGELVVP